jgi:hypothetical protein
MDVAVMIMQREMRRRQLHSRRETLIAWTAVYSIMIFQGEERQKNLPPGVSMTYKQTQLVDKKTTRGLCRHVLMIRGKMTREEMTHALTLHR